MSNLNRDKLKKMILQEMKFLGIGAPAPMGMMGGSQMRNDHGCDACGASPCGCDEYDDMGEDALMGAHTSTHTPMMGGAGKGQVSREDCCAAVMCMIECCSCPVTKAALMECCEDILAGDFDH